jgi:hypothetical protein
LARYGGAFLAQFDYNNLAGAAVRVAEALLIGRLAELVAARALGRPMRALRYAALLPYFLLCGRVDQNPAAALMVIGMLAAAWAGAAIPLSRLAWRRAWHVALTILVAYALAGAAGRDGLWVMLAGFGVLAVLAERRRTGEARCGWLVAYLAAPLLAAWVGGRFMPPPGELLPDAPTLLTHGLTLLLLAAMPLVVLLLTLWPAAATVPPWMERRAARVLAMAGGLVLVSALSVDVCAAQPAREQAEWDNLVLAGRWDEVLARANAKPRLEPLAIHDVDTALARRGLMGDRMFAYRQDHAALLLPMIAPSAFSQRFRLADQYLALGRLDDAEFALHNTLSHTGDNPYIVGRLALVYLTKGDVPAARLYLTLLSHDLIHGRWARHWLRALDRDPRLDDEPEIVARRAAMLTRDDLLAVTDIAAGGEDSTFHQNRALLSVLDEHPRNRLALDYLMALYLLTGHPDGVALDIRRLSAGGGQHIPAAWEDALLLVLDQPGAEVDLGDLTISEEGRQRFARFKRAMWAHRGDFRAAWPEVSRDFAGTYLAYYTQVGMSR